MTVFNIYSAARDAIVGKALADKRGAAMVEYALLAGLIAVVAIAALNSLGSSISGSFNSIANKV